MPVINSPPVPLKKEPGVTFAPSYYQFTSGSQVHFSLSWSSKQQLPSNPRQTLSCLLKNLTTSFLMLRYIHVYPAGEKNPAPGRCGWLKRKLLK